MVDWQTQKDLDLLRWLIRDLDKIYSTEEGISSLSEILATKLDESRAYTIEQVNELLSAKNSEILNLVYPVGAIYMSINDIDPSTLFGGTWERIKDTFLLSRGDTYPLVVDDVEQLTGGEAEHTLTTAELPSHDHGNVYSQNVSETKRYAWYSASGSNIGYGRVEVGGGQAHNNMPPYLVVNVWKRIE